MPPGSWLMRSLLLAAAYYVAGRLALLLAIPPGYATAIWPAAGVALAGLLAFGNRVWPGVALASFCINLPTALDASTTESMLKPMLLAAELGAGASLQALAGAWLVRRAIGYPVAFAKEIQIGKLLALGGPVACLVSASVGVASLWLSGALPGADAPFNWLTWWMGDTIGVLVFIPLFLVWTARPEQLTRRKKILISVPTALLFAMVTGLFVQASTLEQHRIHVEFERRADSVAQALAIRLNGYTEALRAVADFFQASERVDRQTFQAFTAGALSRYPGLQALAWDARVAASLRSDYEDAVRGEGYPRFQISQRGARGALVLASARTEYFPITFIEPLAANATALGFDPASDASRRGALTQARDSAAPTATAPIDLVQGAGDHSGIAIFMPVFQPHTPHATPAQRQQALRGYAAAVFQTSDLMARFLRTMDTQGMRLRVHDVADRGSARLLYPAHQGATTGAAGTAARLPADTHDTLIRTATLNVAGRRWQIGFYLPAEELAKHRSWLAWSVLAAGMLFTALCSVLLLLAAGRTVAIENEVSSRTAELEAGNLALQENEQRTSDIRDNVFDAYIVIDAASRILEWSGQAERLFGWLRADALGARLTDTIIPPQHRQAHAAGMGRYLATAAGPVLNRSIEITALHRDGRQFPIELKIWARRNGSGEPEFHAFVHGIGPRLMANRRLAAQTAAAAALIESSTVADAGPKLLQAVCNALGWSVGLLWILDRSDNELRCAELWQMGTAARFEAQSRMMTFASGVGLPGRVLSSGKPSWIADVALDPNFPRAETALADGLHGAFAVPVLNGVQALGVIEFFSSAIEEPDPELLGMMDTLGNLLGQFIARINVERALEQEGEFLTALLDNITEGIVACDEHGILTVFNRATRELHGLPEQPLGPEQWAEHYDLYLADGVTPMQMVQIPLFRALSGEQIREMEMVIAPKGRPRRVVVCNGRALFNRAGEKLGAVVAMHDITERKEGEQRLQQLAHFDALTGLPNRRLFHESLRSAMALADAQGWLVFLLFLDLDNFKDINDNLGHAVGDELLHQVGQRLLGCLRLRDTVGRLGGDEFGVILLTSGDPQIAARVANKIHDALRAPFELEGNTVSTTASIGITVYPTDTADLHSLERYADLAMYDAKQGGRNAHRFYTAAMNLRAREKLELESALRQALAREEFVLHYQPKVCLRTGRWTGVEALLRWHRPDHGLVPPGEFISVLEDTGLIVPVGAWVVTAACRQLRDWKCAGIGPLPIAVNVSAQQVTRKNLLLQSPESGGRIRVGSDPVELWSATAECLQEHGVTAGQLEFELTESTVMADAEQNVEMLQRLKALGVQVSVDDFGTGYSSLAYLRRFPLDAIKIDGSFIRDVTRNAEDASITLAIIGIAHRLNLQVIAEGVETAEQLEFLRANGCDQAQGYYLARPMSVQKIEQLWRETGGIVPGLA